MAPIEKDFEELLQLFNKHRVKYCIVGAYAVAFHAVPRYTKDIDLLVEPNEVNGSRIVAALADFGFGQLDISPADFAVPGRFIQLGYEPVRIDLSTSISGVTFSQVWKNRVRSTIGTQKVQYIGLKELIRNKKASGRKQDLADLDILRRANSKK